MHLLPIAPAALGAAALVASTATTGESATLGALRLACAIGRTPTPSTAATSKCAAPARLARFVVDEGEAGLVLDLERKRTRRAAAKRLGALAPVAAGPGVGVGVQALAIVARDVVPVRESAELVRLRVRCIGNILEFEVGCYRGLMGFFFSSPTSILHIHIIYYGYYTFVLLITSIADLTQKFV